MNSIIDESKIYTVSESANLLGFCKLTVLRNIRSGKLKAFCPGGKRYRITGADLVHFLTGKTDDVSDTPKAATEAGR
jgi:excisionase family DNA binding protein